MPIFEIENGKTKRIRPTKFSREKKLQKLIESNLKTIFNCEFIASEYSTGNLHAGRIDTLALSEDFNPVIIEYKKVASSQLINQSLYYLHWITDHRGDFQLAVNKKLKQEIEVDWSDIRVICIAPEYKKYDLHAVQVMGANIELWQYKKYENNILSIEEVYRQETSENTPNVTENSKNPVMVAAGKKAAMTRKTATYTIEQHTSNHSSKKIIKLFNTVREYIIELDTSIEEAPKKNYIAYKTSQNFVCLLLNKNKIRLYLKLNPKDISPIPKQGRDMREVGHLGTGDFELTLESIEDFNQTKKYIDEALKNIGG